MKNINSISGGRTERSLGQYFPSATYCAAIECQFLSVNLSHLSTNDFYVCCKFVCPSCNVLQHFKTPRTVLKKIHHFYSFLSFICYHRIRISTLKSLYRQLA